MVLTVVLTIVHVLVCLFLIVVVLLQSGKAADLAGAFGGMGSQTVFGPRGAATALSRATTIAAGLFMVTSLTLGLVSNTTTGTGSKSVLETTADPAASQSQSATPAVDPTKKPKMELFNEKGEKVGEQELKLPPPPAPGSQPTPAETVPPAPAPNSQKK